MILSSLQIFAVKTKTVKKDITSISLNEKWLFKIVKSDADVPADFASVRYDDSQWTFMSIPAQWGGEQPSAWRQSNYVGLYRGWVKMLPQWRGKKIVLHLGNTTSPADVYVNGKLIGTTSSEEAVSEFDVTDQLHVGRNLYAFRMHRWNAGEEGRSDVWYPGITSDSYIYTTPMPQPDTLRVDSLLSDSLRVDSVETAPAPRFATLPDSVVRNMLVLVAGRDAIEPVHGYIDTRDHMLRTIQRLKNMHFDAVSYSKNASDPMFISLCEDNGIRVVTNSPTFPDRMIDERGRYTPAAFKMMHSYQPVKGKATDLFNGKISVYNGYAKGPASDLKLVWQLYQDGKLYRQGMMPMEVPYGETRTVTIPYYIAAEKSMQEVLLSVKYQNIQDSTTVGFDMFDILPYDYRYVVQKNSDRLLQTAGKVKPKMRNKKNEDRLIVSDKNYRVVFDKKTGFLSSYEYGNRVLVKYVLPNAETTLEGISSSKPSKETGTTVTAVYRYKDTDRLFIVAYNVSPAGMLTITPNSDIDLLLEYPAAAVCMDYYAKDEFTPVRQQSLEENVDRIRWWQQTTQSGFGVTVMGRTEYQVKQTGDKCKMLVSPVKKGASFYVFPK